MLNPINKTIELGDGRTITIETGKLAKQADGAVTVRMNNTILLATVCAAKDANPGVDFMPLQVEYKEKYSACGRFPGGFTKREGKASDYEILTARLVDRALRPLFPDNYHAEVYVNIILFSADGEDMPDALAGLAASAALAVSDIPFNGPISEVRVARVDGKFVINPTFAELEKADIDIMVGATLDNIMMVEGEMNEVQESEMLDAIKFAHEAIKAQCQAQIELSEACGKTVKREYCHEVNDDELRKDVHDKCYDKAYAIAVSGTGKQERTEAFEKIVEDYKAQFTEEEDDVLNHGKERFLLHYNFPPFSTGEAKASRGVGRREIGHGHLAWRALKRMIPENYPYVVRVISDILESNGSSSMATVCAGTLALRDAGIPMKKPVSGIAMGLISENHGTNYAILSDILGDEDHLGDMDFKVTGTKDGITATQMDIKVDGLSYEILERALAQAREGRMYILGKILEAQPEARPSLKPHAPRIESMTISKEFIGAVIGPGGKIIQGIQEKTGAVITIEEVDGVGQIEISGPNEETITQAIKAIKAIVAVPEIGEVYEGKISSIMPYGAFVEFMPGKDGLLHISEIDWKRLDTVEQAGLKEGDPITVKLVDIDPKTGKFKLSRRALLPKPEGFEERPARPNRGPRPERGPRK